ncbi:MAG: SAM-dependent methyltransferase [Crocinitomicaceae bacterium]|nr:SAM-dependent methyltransferase [Crocinitomicaceae bacterium]|tara:strand:+ start:6031 stop:6699 length:669 start_codon:yes stop_codon:yes gene_type:complete
MSKVFQQKQSDWEKQAQSSEDPGAQVGRPNQNSEFSHLLERLKQQLDLQDTDTILDVGCGNGFLLEHLAPRNALAGVDYAEQMINLANSRLQGDFRVASADQLPFENEQFDKVLCYSILHYMQGETMGQKVLEECIRVTKKGGVIFIGDILDQTEENRIKSSSDLEYEKKIPLIHRYSSWQFYDLETLKQVALQYGCKAEIVNQPETFKLSNYRKDLRIKKL